MWEFLDRLLSLALPRIRDFRGLSDAQFDGNGNYTFGLTEQSVFHEIDQDKIDRVRGMDITVVTARTTTRSARCSSSSASRSGRTSPPTEPPDAASASSCTRPGPASARADTTGQSPCNGC